MPHHNIQDDNKSMPVPSTYLPAGTIRRLVIVDLHVQRSPVAVVRFAKRSRA